MADYEEDYDENTSVDEEDETFDEEIFENEVTDVLEEDNIENEVDGENDADIFWEDMNVDDDDMTPLNESSASLNIRPKPVVYKTRPFMTKYEFAKVIGVRSEQILYGSQVLVSTKNTDPIKIALDELRERKLPFLVRRKIHEKNKYIYEDWKIESFKNIDWLLEYYSN